MSVSSSETVTVVPSDVWSCDRRVPRPRLSSGWGSQSLLCPFPQGRVSSWGHWPHVQALLVNPAQLPRTRAPGAFCSGDSVPAFLVAPCGIRAVQ